MLHNGRLFRYRIITNYNCNQNCYFCFQPFKEQRILDINRMEATMKKVGKLERATIMGGESLLLPNIVDYFEVTNNYANTICLVTNGTKLTEQLTKDLVKNGLEEMAISISSMEQYIARRDQILIAKEYVPNLRINIPKSYESIGDKLHLMIDTMLNDDLGVVVCEDLMGRYGEYELETKFGAKLINNDGHNFLTFKYKDKIFGMFAKHDGDDTSDGYDLTDCIICPEIDKDYGARVFSDWRLYCKYVGNLSLS